MAEAILTANSDLFNKADPKINIALGTAYLEYVYQMFGRSRILASIAYNAGPGRVNSWLNASAGRADAIAFIESLPFSETAVMSKMCWHMTCFTATICASRRNC